MQEVEARQARIKCSQHFYKKATFFLFDISKDDAQAVCQYCALSNTDPNKILLFIEEINSDDPYIMIANWPPLKKLDLIHKFAEICDEIYINSFHSKTRVEQIIEYFAKLREKFIQKTQQIEKKFLQIASEIQIEDLMKVYNEIIEKDKLREILKNYGNNSNDNELTKLIQNMKAKMESNTSVIETMIEQYTIYKKKLNLNQFDLFFDGIYTSLDNFFNDQEKSLNTQEVFIDYILRERLQANIKTIEPGLQEQIKKLNAHYETYIQNVAANQQRGTKKKLIEQQTQLVDSLTGILKQHIDVIKMPLADRIKVKLQQKQIMSNQHDGKIDQFKISQMSGYNFNYIDVDITEEHVGESFSIKINNLQQWIGIGIVDKNQLHQKSYKFTGLYNDKFCYVISQNGYSWSLLSENQNKKKISFNFKTGDIIKITIQLDMIHFENTTISDTFQMEFLFEEGRSYCPGFCLFNQFDQIEFV